MSSALKIIGIALFAIIFLFFLGTALMFITKTCPPKGPWPMPPWCEGSEFPKLPTSSNQLIPSLPPTNANPNSADNASQMPSANANSNMSDNASKAPSTNVPQPLPIPIPAFQQDTSKQLDYSFSMPSYIAPLPSSTKKLTLGIGMMDFWGQVCLNNMCEDPTIEIAPSMKRLAQTGSKLILFSDYVSLGTDLSISSIPLGGAHTASQQDLSSVASNARKNGMKSMLITNLYGDGRTVIGSNPTSVQLQKLLSGWNATMAQQASRAQVAGFDYIILNPRDIHFMFDDSRGTEANMGLAAMMPTIRQLYRGKVCIWGNPWSMQTPLLLSQVDCVISDLGIDWIMKGRNGTSESLQAGWKQHLSDPAFASFSGKEQFILVLMPSYENALSKGWIEPVADYSNTKLPEKDWKTQALVYDSLFREIYSGNYSINGVISYGYWWNDNMYPQSIGINSLSHSIRGKDAEHVFYAWGAK